MKHTLPWNVIGIPQDVRAKARAAAQREGATVGEWLTRRIMSEEAQMVAAEPSGVAPPMRAAPDTKPSPTRSDTPSPNQRPDATYEAAFRRIDETFRNLARRLENNERAQIEAQRAMSAAAGEINAATRDQAEAFQLIAMRIDRVERQPDTGALRDAVRGLHQGLSRLSEQIAKHTNESSGKVATLTSNVELLADRMVTAQEDSNHRSQEIEQRLAALDVRMRHSEERLRQTEERIVAASRLDETVASLQSRMNSAEERMQESLGHYLEGIERSLEQIGERLRQAETHGKAAGRIEASLCSLTSRIETVENQKNAAATTPAESARTPLVLIESSVDGAVRFGDLRKAQVQLATPSVIASSAPPLPEAPASNSDVTKPSLTEPKFDAVGPQGDVRPSIRTDRASTADYLAQARRAARGAGRKPASGSRYRLGFLGGGGLGARISHQSSMALVLLILIGAGFLLTRTIQNHANSLTSLSSNLIALDAPAKARAPAAGKQKTPGQPGPTISGTGVQQSADAGRPVKDTPAKTVASASVLPFDNIGSSTLAQLIARANGGDAKAAMALGIKYADGDGVSVNETESVFWLQKAADAGEAPAQYRLGTFYERGRGVVADAGQALRWYAEAAKRGNRRAMHNLGVDYADGAGTTKNFLEAARWFKDAADLGLTDSQFNLAVLYERGLGVKTSLAEAYKWYSIAATAGDSESKARVAALASRIKPADRDAADKAVKAYKPRPVDIAANDG